MTKSAFAIVGLVALVVGIYAKQWWDGDRYPNSAAAVAHGALPVGLPEAPRPVPELRFVDETGAPKSLVGFRGRAILLNIWATWCVPCRKEMPALDRLQATLGGADFEVVALSIDRGGAVAVKSFYQELGLRALRVYVDASAQAFAKLRGVGIPLTLLVDRRGCELWRVVGPVEWDDPAVKSRIRSDISEAPKRGACSA